MEEAKCPPAANGDRPRGRLFGTGNRIVPTAREGIGKYLGSDMVKGRRRRGRHKCQRLTVVRGAARVILQPGAVKLQYGHPYRRLTAVEAERMPNRSVRKHDDGFVPL